MSFKYGFYNSQNGDRKYDAEDISKIFDGVIADGVFATVGDGFIVGESAGMNIAVGTGRAWFNHTWTVNTTPFLLPIEESDLILDRIDLVVLEINRTPTGRVNTLKVIKGLPSDTPVTPDLSETADIKQKIFAEILVSAGVVEITADKITNKIGTVGTPFVTGLIETLDSNALLTQWAAIFDAKMIEWEGEFDGSLVTWGDEFTTWFDTIKGQIGTDLGAQLAQDILDLQNEKASITKFVVTISATDAWTDNGDHFTLVKPLVGILDEHNPYMALNLGGVSIANIPAMQKAYAKIYDMITADGQVTFYCLTEPVFPVDATIDLDVIANG